MIRSNNTYRKKIPAFIRMKFFRSCIPQREANIHKYLLLLLSERMFINDENQNNTNEETAANK